jgi:hypothetical protein
MANALDLLGRTMLRIGGMTPQQIRLATRANKPAKPLPVPKGAKPKPKPKPPAPGSITPKGQTNLFNAQGNPRDFRNPQVAANRPPTLSPVPNRGTAGLNPPPTRPAQTSPGQGSLFGNNPNAKPSGNFRAPNVPKPGTGGFKPTAQALEWFQQQGTGPAVNRALRSSALGKNLTVNNGLGLQTLLMIANGVQDQLLTGQAKTNKEQWSIGGPGWDNAGPLPGQRDMRAPAAPKTNNGPVGPQQTPEMINNYYQDRNARHNALRADLNAQPPLRRSPAAGAPIHSAPRQFASAAPSVYAPQVGQAPKPNAPIAKVAENPFSGIGDVRGNAVGQGPAADSKFQAGNQQYGGQSLKGIDQNGVDMERRRAFLDADNSLDGMKAIKELLRRRKLSISVED